MSNHEQDSGEVPEKERQYFDRARKETAEYYMSQLASFGIKITILPDGSKQATSVPVLNLEEVRHLFMAMSGAFEETLRIYFLLSAIYRGTHPQRFEELEQLLKFATADVSKEYAAIARLVEEGWEKNVRAN